jgi:hypothetical protein
MIQRFNLFPAIPAGQQHAVPMPGIALPEKEYLNFKILLLARIEGKSRMVML